MSWELIDLDFNDLYSEIEQRCSSDILRVFKNDNFVCLYKLIYDTILKDVFMTFKLIIGKDMTVKIINQENEYNVEKLSSWLQLNELIERFFENDTLHEFDEIIEEETIPEFDQIIEESNLEYETFDPEQIIIEEESTLNNDDHGEMIEELSLQCENCHIIFKNEIGLRHHLPSCTTKKTVVQKCSICDESFSTNLQLRLHMNKTHGDSSRSNCPYCNKTVVNNGSLQRHIKAVHLKQRPHKCSTCGKAFATSTMKSAHEKTHKRNSEIQKYLTKDTSGIISYQCPNCNDQFDTSDHLKSHIERNCYRPRKKRAYKYPCSYCGKQFVTKIQAAKHYSDEHNVMVNNPQKFCFECNIEVEDYVNHIRSHTCQFKCNYCGTKFLTEETCRQHEISKHSVPEERPFKCSFESCNTSFKSENHLRSHISSMHDPIERHYSCEICGNKFALKSLLTAHFRTHDDNGAIFSCKICGKSFKKLATLKNHSIAFHQTDEIYQCGIDECHERYKFLQDLKVHRQHYHGLNLNIQKYFQENA